MKIRLAVAQFFSTRPLPERVTGLGTRPNRKAVLSFRFPEEAEGVGYVLTTHPSRQAFFNTAVSQLIHFDLKLVEIEILKKILPLFALNSREFNEFQIYTFSRLCNLDLKKDRGSVAQMSQELKRFLRFTPSLGVAGSYAELDCRRFWTPRQIVIRPERKRGYDDKGSLPPEGSIPWQMVASLAEPEASNSMATQLDLSNFLHGFRAKAKPSEESYRPDENPIDLILRRYLR